MTSARKYRLGIEKAVESMGFNVDSIEKTRGQHLKVHVTDDAGNKFFAIHSSTVSAAECRALNNFKSDVRRMSNKAKGLLDD